MKNIVLNIGEVRTVKEGVTFSCFGLGSCIGLFVQDRAAGISGGAHILLPENEENTHTDGKAYTVSDAIQFLMNEFRRKGSTLDALRAKITGGASLLSTTIGMGERNITSVVQHLVDRKIYIAARDVGGNYSRTALFNTRSGEMLIRTPESNSFKIF